jgi:hypothetical protein
MRDATLRYRFLIDLVSQESGARIRLQQVRKSLSDVVLRS